MFPSKTYVHYGKVLFVLFNSIQMFGYPSITNKFPIKDHSKLRPVKYFVMTPYFNEPNYLDHLFVRPPFIIIKS